MLRLRKIVLACAIAVSASAGCQILAGLEEPRDEPSDAGTDAPSIDGSDGAPDGNVACRRDGVPCFCNNPQPNLAEAPVLACADFDDDESARNERFGLGPGLPTANIEAITFGLTTDKTRSAPNALSVTLVPAIDVTTRSLSLLASDASPESTLVDLSLSYSAGDAGDAGEENTLFLALLELSPSTRDTVVLGVHQGQYFLSYADSRLIVSDILARSVKLTEASDEFESFALSIERVEAVPGCVDAGSGFAGVVRAATTTATGSQVLRCVSIGDAGFGPNTQLYLGGYIKDPTREARWRYDNLVIRKKKPL